jgi:hypothetical protein
VETVSVATVLWQTVVCLTDAKNLFEIQPTTICCVQVNHDQEKSFQASGSLSCEVEVSLSLLKLLKLLLLWLSD